MYPGTDEHEAQRSHCEGGKRRQRDDIPDEARRKQGQSGQIAAARALLGMTQQQLADAVGIAKHTIVRFETEQNVPRALTIKALQDELERRGIEFQNSGDPGVRLFRSRAKTSATP